MSNTTLESHTLEFTLNGEAVRHSAAPKRSVLDVLREDLDLRSIKPGCAPQGVCGCCAILVDDKVRLACALPFRSLEGKAVETLEGLSDEDRTVLAESFVNCGGTQCGYCTPGIAMQTHALLKKNTRPTDADINKALHMHICRCTGWVKIRDSIHHAAAMKRGECAIQGECQGGVGSSYPLNDGRELVLGERPYIDDMIRPGMLHGALVWTPHPRCKILRIDASKALALDGVRAVVTAKDFGPNRKIGLVHRDRAVMIAEGEETRCVADVVAAVAAETRELALLARDLIEVEVEELPPLVDLDEAASDPENILTTCRVQKGDAQTALAEAPLVIEEEFKVQVVDQAFLEPEASLVVPVGEDGLHVYSCGQGVFDDQKQLCELFGMPPEKLVVELVPTGGGFGAKEDLNVQPHAAKLAQVTGRPVKLSLSMKESTRFHPKKHAMRIRYTIGATEAGDLLAVRADIVGDTGGYASVGDKVLERAAEHACGPYRVPHVDVEARAVYTNNPVGGAMRGFGVNQVTFGLEGCLDRLADRIGMDRWQLRWRLALEEGDRFGTGQLMDASVGIKPTLEAIKPHYDRAKAEGKHVGIACGVKNTGMGNGVVEKGRVELHVRSSQEVCIKTGFTEMGQGHDTVMRQFAAEATGLPEDLFVVECDTSVTVDTGMTTGSRATFLGGNAVLAAAPSLVSELAQAGGALEELVGNCYVGEWVAPDTHKPGDSDDEVNPVTHYAFGWATQLAIVTADGELEEVVAAHDVGRAINPVLCEGQIEGGVHMGIGYALSEELVVEEGVPDTRFRNLGILKARFTPKITCILVEQPDLNGPWGAKGVGEMGLVPTAPAIAAAIQSQDGIWRTRLPMKDSAAARALGVRTRKKS
ncbi:MAG: selenium-dependent xanthine dehydrogenase [Myxococcota bacterium]|nr:selenium-dependent xanthine dehydrogenase [Myxococcota bacterium]